ncbi:hypothetical protein STRTUCAR8_10008 [Streptomyces turgidiscabies Car8]|uniref:Uncharacterized protein n=1 Tax=Streptomyces turgidiscabies (strain Car8) TaxID=698760 RepID=L7F973_STRT8|nr:hypothetical protein STRTUCAR8_10008 [Streptomyces turgidiscabies Car8]
MPAPVSGSILDEPTPLHHFVSPPRVVKCPHPPSRPIPKE